MTEAFQVATTEFDVEVALVTGQPLSGKIFLRSAAGGHAGAETVEDRLNDGKPFLPLLPAIGNETLLVGKHQVLYLRTPRVAESERDQALTAALQPVTVRIELGGFGALDGDLYVALPPGRRRTLDWLNSQRGPFVRLRQASHDCWIHLRAISVVQDHPSSDTPVERA